MNSTAIATITAAAIAGAVTLASRWLPVRRRPKQTEAQRLDGEKWRLMDEIRAELNAARVELQECRERSDHLEQNAKVDRWRVALLVRALQEAGIPIPSAALLDVKYDPMTDSYRVNDRNA